MDSLHKYLRPETYSCSLCRITHGLVGPKKAWKEYLEACGRTVYFLHRDEIDGFTEGQGVGSMPLPAILELRGGELVPVLNAEELNRIQSLDGLLGALEDRLRDL